MATAGQHVASTVITSNDSSALFLPMTSHGPARPGGLVSGLRDSQKVPEAGQSTQAGATGWRGTASDQAINEHPCTPPNTVLTCTADTLVFPVSFSGPSLAAKPGHPCYTLHYQLHSHGHSASTRLSPCRLCHHR